MRLPWALAPVALLAACAAPPAAPSAAGAGDEPTLPFAEPLPTQDAPAPATPVLEPAGTPSSLHDRG